MSSLPAVDTTTAEPDAVTADWALFSKVPGQKMDYEVLASTMDAAAAVRCIRTLITGHTNNESVGRPEQLPWFSIAGQVGDQASFVFMELGWSTAQDGTGQPITPARLLTFDWAAAAGRTLTFRRVAEMFVQLRWTDLQSGPAGVGQDRMRLPVPPSDLDEIAREIELEFGFDFVAGLAALIIEGHQVVLTSATTYPTTPDRVRLIDAVFALLPYAHRVNVSASTWASYRGRPKVRLTFAERPADGQLEVALDRPVVPTPTADGQAYLRILHNLRAKGRTVGQIVRHLAHQRDPQLCGTSSAAVELLMAMDVTEAVQHQIRVGVASVAEVHGVLAQFGWDGLDHDDMRQDYRRFLIDRMLSGQPDAADAWTALNATWTTYVRDGLSRKAYGLLTERDLDRLRLLATVVDTRAGAKAELVRNLTDAVTYDPRPEYVELYARFLGTVSGGIAADGAIHELFLARPRAGIQMIMHLAAADPDRLAAVLRIWQPLMTDDRRWARPALMAATGQMTLADRTDFAALRELQPDGPLTVVGIASRLGHLPAMVRAQWELAADVAANLPPDPGHPQRTLFRQHLEPAWAWIRAGGPQWVDIARIDMLSLMAGGPAMGFGYTGLSSAYVEELARCWHTPAPQRVREPLMATLSHVLEPRASGRLGVAGINDLIRVVDRVEPGLRGWAANWVSAYLHHNLDRRSEIQWSKKWIDLVAPDLKTLEELAEQCRNDTAARPILEKLAPLLQGFPHDHLLEVVRSWLLPDRETRVLELVAYLRREQHSAARAFAADLLRMASDPTVCREFAPRFVALTIALGPVIAEIAKEFGRDGEPRRNFVQRGFDRITGGQRSGHENPPVAPGQQQPGITTVEGNR